MPVPTRLAPWPMLMLTPPPANMVGAVGAVAPPVKNIDTNIIAMHVAPTMYGVYGLTATLTLSIPLPIADPRPCSLAQAFPVGAVYEYAKPVQYEGTENFAARSDLCFASCSNSFCLCGHISAAIRAAEEDDASRPRF